MICEKGKVITFNGEEGEKFNKLAKNPNKETVAKRDLFFKEIDEFMKEVTVEDNDISFEL